MQALSFVASSNTYCKFIKIVYLVISQYFSCVWFVSLALLYCKPFSSSFQTFPCMVILFVVDNAHCIFAFFKTFLAQVFAEVFLFCCSWMYFLMGFSKVINLFKLSIIICGLYVICKKTGVNLWKLYKLLLMNYNLRGANNKWMWKRCKLTDSFWQLISDWMRNVWESHFAIVIG